MTGTGLFLGKLKYCSPEQAGALPAGHADRRAERHLFVRRVLYEMLSGSAPFESDDSRGIPRQASPHGGAAARRRGSARAHGTRASPPSWRGPSRRNARDATAARTSSPTRSPPCPSPRRTEATGHARRPNPTTRSRRAGPPGSPPRPSSSPWRRPRSSSCAPRRRSDPLCERAAVATSAPAPAAPRESALPTAMAAPTAASTPPPGSVSPPPAVPPAPPEADRAEAEDAAAPPLLTDGDAPGARPSGRRVPTRAARAGRPRSAATANRFVASHPAAPLSREIETSLPGYLKRQATASLDHAQPVPAHLYFRAYQQLQFAPPDVELESRFGASPGLAATPRARPRRDARRDGRPLNPVYLFPSTL